MIEIRNAKFINKEYTIVDLEIKHPDYGWIPYTFNYDEQDESYDLDIREWLKTNTPAKYITPIVSREILIEDAKITRDNAEISNIVVHGVEWQVREKDQSRMEKVIDTAKRNGTEDTYVTYWRLANDSLRKTTIKDLEDVLDAVTHRMGDIFDKYSSWRNTDINEPFEYKQ